MAPTVNTALDLQKLDQEKNGEVDKGDGEGTVPTRDEWSSKVDFVLSCIGFAVGLGNVWRFPYLCYKNGGGAFLVPYFLCLLCGGIPIFIMEISLGQFMKAGGYGVWNIFPLMRGIGITTLVICFLLNIYYIVILAWDIYYLSQSFTSVLPWSHCNNTWNTERCRISFLDSACKNSSLDANSSWVDSGCLNVTSLAAASSPNVTYVDPVVEFWERHILQISSGVDEPNGLVWQLVLSLFICWAACYFCVWKGVKLTGKVVYITATFPYIMLTVLVVRGVTLDGAGDGLKFYLNPDFSRLGEIQIWIDAGTQIFFSYAIGLGAMIALGSYNKFHNNCYRDSIIVACINSFTSIYSGICIFSVLGFMAKEQGVTVADVAESGPGLAFIAYPKAVTQMPCAPLWAILFFLMILLLGGGTQFVGLEAVITVFVDWYPKLRRPVYRELFIAAYCLVSFLIGLSMVSRGGMYVFQMFDYYSASGMTLLWVCFFEAIALAWGYGASRYYNNLEMMIGYRINPWLRICWMALTPMITCGIFCAMMSSYRVLTYNRTYQYPDWAIGVGMCLALASMIWIPLYAIVSFIKTPGSLRERWQFLSTPQLPDHVIDFEKTWKNGEYAAKYTKLPMQPV